MSAATRLAILERPSQPLDEITARLRDWRCTCQSAATTGELLSALGRHPIDIVMIDAGSDEALAALAALTGDARFRTLPIVVAADDEVAFVASQALAFGAADVLALPLADAELFARIRALARLAAMETEHRRRAGILVEFGIAEVPDRPRMPIKERVEILLIGPPGPEQIQVMGALGQAATIAFAETADQALERLLHQEHDLVIITGFADPRALQRLCGAIRDDSVLFDLPILLIGHARQLPAHALPFEWGVSDVLFLPFDPGVLRLRVHGWIHQQQLRRRLRGIFGLRPLPSVVDGLTRLFSHGFAYSYLNAMIVEATRTATPLAVAGFVLDRLDLINREHGYAAGDRALAEVGRTIARSCRAEDLPARVGGDRFVIVVKNAGTGEAQRVTERIRAVVDHTAVPVGGQRRLRLDLRAGFTELGRGDDAPALIERAFDHLSRHDLRRAS
jgi:diguanylate cyclase (GGDEF)-like protein